MWKKRLAAVLILIAAPLLVAGDCEIHVGGNRDGDCDFFCFDGDSDCDFFCFGE